MAANWDRMLWGVEFRGNIKEEPPMLLGSAWSGDVSEGYDGEPTRALLFTTRNAARAWCKKQNDEWQSRDQDDIVQRWRVTPVRVRETIMRAVPEEDAREGAEG